MNSISASASSISAIAMCDTDVRRRQMMRSGRMRMRGMLCNPMRRKRIEDEEDIKGE